MRRRQLLTAISTATAALAFPRAAYAAKYPDRPVRIVAPYAAGGTTDFITRLIATHLQRELGQTFIVDNKPGAGGNIGSNSVVKAPPDGYTLLAGSLSTFALNFAVQGNLGHDPLTDLIPVAMTTIVPGVVVVPTALGVKDLRGLVDLMRANPGKYNYGSAGNGTSSHVALSLLLAQTGTQATHVPYRGVSSPTRLKVVPQVPTAAEAGFPKFEAYSWNCLFAPKGTPPEIVEALFNTVTKVLKDPAVLNSFEEQGMLPVENQTPASVAKYTRSEFERWVPIVRKMNITAN
jgi:tripartite-type tricarboxylate transporter receptor subunit TctC